MGGVEPGEFDDLEDLSSDDFSEWAGELVSGEDGDPEREAEAWRYWVLGHPDRPVPPVGYLACEACGALRPLAALLVGYVQSPDPALPVETVMVVCCAGCRPGPPSLNELREVMGSLRWPNRSETPGRCVVCGEYTVALDSAGSYCHPKCMG